MSSFPDAPERLTAAWLGEVLDKRVSDFRIEPFAAGVGVIGQVTRVHLEYSDEPGPAMLIAKFAAAHAGAREVAALYDMYGREHRFYTQLQKRVPVRTPRCFFSAYRAEDQRFVLLLEALTDFRVGDQLQGATLDDARRVLAALASLHAAFWQPDRRDPHLAWVPLHDNEAQRAGMQQGFEIGWPVVLRDFAELVPTVAHASAAQLPASVPAWLHELCQPPITLAHADVRLDNLLFSNEEVAFVDWQSVCLSAPEQDVAYFLTQSLADDVRRAHARALLAHYHEELVAQGVASYPFAQCAERYRLAALYLLCYAVTIAGTLDMGNARGRRLAEALLGRSLRAIDELDGFAPILRSGKPI